MEHLLFLAHRLPYPPDKGDKIRSWRLLQHFAATRRVHLGCFVDDPADRDHVATVRELCAGVWIGDRCSRVGRVRALRGFATGEPLSFAHFWSPSLARWVQQVRAAHPGIPVFAFSSGMAPYLKLSGGALAGDGPEIVDLVDLDSDKWRQYAALAGLPMRWVFEREARRTARAEIAIARGADLSLLVTDLEAAELRERPGVPPERVHVLSNGVDAAFFDPARAHERPAVLDGAPAIVFTGAMDYRANVDAVHWFATEVLPLIRARAPGARFFVVGARPAPEVVALGRRPGVRVTGRVADVRPWLAHAHVVVAPLRVARGIQNKVLEAMAMARPVVCTPPARAGLQATPGEHLLVADNPARFCGAVLACASDPDLAERLGAGGRALVERAYRWEARLARLEELIGAVRAGVEPHRARVA